MCPTDFVILTWSKGELQRAPAPPLGRSPCSSPGDLQALFCCWTHFRRIHGWIELGLLRVPDSDVRLAPADAIPAGARLVSAGLRVGLDESRQVVITARLSACLMAARRTDPGGPTQTGPTQTGPPRCPVCGFQMAAERHEVGANIQRTHSRRVVPGPIDTQMQTSTRCPVKPPFAVSQVIIVILSGKPPLKIL